MTGPVLVFFNLFELSEDQSLVMDSKNIFLEIVSFFQSILVRLFMNIC